MNKTKIAVVAVGGNALIRNPGENALEQQHEAKRATAENVVDLIAAGWRVVLTHGNGPQVGFILRRSEIAKDAVPGVPLEYAVGDTQGAIGFMFQNALNNALTARGIGNTPVVALVTQTLIDPNDAAFSHPDKPIGDYMTFVERRRRWRQLRAGISQKIRAAAGDASWHHRNQKKSSKRRLFALCLNKNVLVIACGGGGIPVWRDASGSLLPPRRSLIKTAHRRCWPANCKRTDAADSDRR